MSETNQATAVIDTAITAFTGSTIVSKAKIVDVLLDVRLASQDPAVAAAVDEALTSFTTPSLVEWTDALAEFRKVRAIAAESPAYTLV